MSARPQSTATPSSPAGSAARATESARASDPRGTDTATPVASGTYLAGDDWRELLTSEPPSGIKTPTLSARWSPSGDALLIDVGLKNGNASDQRVEEMTPDGAVVASFPGFSSSQWLDEDRLILFPSTGSTDEQSVTRAVFRYANGEAIPGAEAYALLDSSDVISNGHGLVAVRYPSNAAAKSWSYRLWSDTGLTPARPGFPLSWSPDGRYLAVVHPTSTGPGLHGWLEVVTTPSMDTVYGNTESAISDEIDLFAAFDPSSTQIAFVSDGVLTIGDLGSGVSDTWPTGSPSGEAGWSGPDALLVADSRTHSAGQFDLSGRLLQRIAQSADHVVRAPDASSVATYFDGELPAAVLTTLTSDEAVQMALPGQLMERPKLSPAGRHLAVVCVVEGRVTAFTADL